MINNSCFACAKHNELMSLRAAVKRFEDGREFKRITDEKDKTLRKLEKAENERQSHLQECKKLKSENKDLSSSLEYLEREHERLFSDYVKLQNRLIQLNAFEKEEFFDRMESVISSLTDKIIQLNKENEELNGSLIKLRARITKDNTNSSIPSSRLPNHKTPPNNREKTGRKPGGQKGHEGYRRKKLKPTMTIHLPPPDIVIDNPDYYKTKKTIKKQIIKAKMVLEVIQYEADVYRSHSTRKKVHAPFPEGIVNEVEYDASVDALFSLLHSHGNISYDKIIEMVSDLTGGTLNLSKGKLAGLEKKFSDKSEKDREEIWNRMLVYPYMHIDGTCIRVNGKNDNVLIETSPAGTLLFHTGTKGFKAVENTPAEEYDGIMIHDGESTFFHYGKAHQGCLVHELRYLKGSIDNEPHLTWAAKMRELLQSMIHHVNEAKRSGTKELTNKEINDFEKEYELILDLAEAEYTEYPPNRKYYIEGYNTMKRLKAHKDDYLHFLHDLKLPSNNNSAELIARKEKMHSKQSGGYRSGKYSQYHCDVLSVIESNKALGISRYDTLLDVFKRR